MTMKGMSETTKPRRKRASKKNQKILAIPATADEIRAAYNLTPAEIRYAKRILDEVSKESSRRKASGSAGR